MKYGILFAFILIISINSAKAQKGLYVNPIFRVGTSSTDQINTNAIPYNPSDVLTYGTELGIGYNISRIRIQTGIGYQRSGYSYEVPSYTEAKSNIYTYFNHLTGTLQLGLVLRNNKRLAIVPYLGATYAMNYSGRTVARLHDGTIQKKKMDKSFSESTYEQSSIYASTKLHFEYRFSQSTAFIFGSSFQYMITDMAKANMILNKETELRNHMIFLDLGILWIFPDKSQSGKSRMPSLYYN